MIRENFNGLNCQFIEVSFEIPKSIEEWFIFSLYENFNFFIYLKKKQVPMLIICSLLIVIMIIKYLKVIIQPVIKYIMKLLQSCSYI